MKEGRTKGTNGVKGGNGGKERITEGTRKGKEGTKEWMTRWNAWKEWSHTGTNTTKINAIFVLLKNEHRVVPRSPCMPWKTATDQRR